MYQEQCKSPTCTANSLKNSVYCFSHYKEGTRANAALMLRRKELLVRRVKRVKTSRSNIADQCSAISAGLAASWIFHRAWSASDNKDLLFGRSAGSSKSPRDPDLLASMAFAVASYLSRAPGATKKKGEAPVDGGNEKL